MREGLKSRQGVITSERDSGEKNQGNKWIEKEKPSQERNRGMVTH